MPPGGSSVRGTLQTRIMQWVAIPFSRVFSWCRDQIWVSCFAGRLLTIWATSKAKKGGVISQSESNDQKTRGSNVEEGMATHSSFLVWRIVMDRGVWRAAAHRVTKSRTWLKWLSSHACTKPTSPLGAFLPWASGFLLGLYQLGSCHLKWKDFCLRLCF